MDENIVDIQFTPEEMLTHQESESFKTKNLAALLNKLPKRQREVIYLKYYYNLNTKQISEVMEVNYQSVVNFMHKAIKRLREDISILTLFNR